MWRMYMLRSKLPGQALKDHTAKDRLEWQQEANVGGIPLSSLAKRFFSVRDHDP